MMLIQDELYEVMMHIIGYGCLTENFCYAVDDDYDHEALLELARRCNDRWGNGCVDIEELEKAIERYNEEA